MIYSYIIYTPTHIYLNESLLYTPTHVHRGIWLTHWVGVYIWVNELLVYMSEWVTRMPQYAYSSTHWGILPEDASVYVYSYICMSRHTYERCMYSEDDSMYVWVCLSVPHMAVCIPPQCMYVLVAEAHSVHVCTEYASVYVHTLSMYCAMCGSLSVCMYSEDASVYVYEYASVYRTWRNTY